MVVGTGLADNDVDRLIKQAQREGVACWIFCTSVIEIA